MSLQLTVQDSPLMLFNFEHQPQPIARLSQTSAASSVTQTFEDAAGRYARTHIRALQSGIAPVQRITLDSDGTRQNNAGRLISIV